MGDRVAASAGALRAAPDALPRRRLPGRGLLVPWLLPLAAGVALGGWIASSAGSQAPPPVPAATRASLPPARDAGSGSAPRACLQAVEQADAAISYLVGELRDQRLETSLQRYVVAARSCRKETSP
jgi:hypothetical protein